MRSNILKNISGDKKLNFFKYIYWLILAYLNIKIERYKINNEIKIINFKPKKKLNLLTNLKSTPSRYWCDLFWQELPFKLLFNKGFKALEVGCGSGIYGKFLEKKDGFKNYVGIDINKKWKFQNKNLKFFLDSYKNVYKYLDKVNFLFTQSALEHFDEDLDFHIKVNQYLKNIKTKKKLLHLHLVPSEQCLITYMSHGYRHFSLRSISKIFSYYSKKNNKFFLFKLGSVNSNKLHLKSIVLPKFSTLFTSRYNDFDYYKKLNDAVLKDIKVKENKKPSFYGIMILTNYQSSEIKKIIDYYK
jgi:hypothetical protein